MNRKFRFGLSALVLICAPVLLMQGLANARNPISPLYSSNGFNLALLSMGQLQFDQENGKLTMSVSSGGVELARKAFAREPLASDALLVLAINERVQGNLERMQAILESADALDKRNANIGALRLEQVALTGDISRTFGMIDRLGTVHPSLTAEFVRPLTAALNDPRTIPVLRDALNARPVWGAAFWRAMPADTNGISNMYELRGLTDVGTSEESDSSLVLTLVNNGLYADAFTFWEGFAGDEHDPLGFVPGTSFPPFGWSLTNGGERTMSPRGEARYEIYIQNETSGELARQLVRLPGGSYSFVAKIIPASEAGNIVASLECALGGDVVGDAQGLSNPARWTVSGDCDAYWLVLEGSAWDRRDPLRVSISDMRLQAGS